MLKPSLYVTGFSLLTQAIGFLKLLLIANYFGVSVELDGYYLALTIPTLLLGFIGGGLQTGFVPIYGKLLAEGNLAQAREFRSALLWLLVALAAVACLVLAQLATPLMHLLISDTSNAITPFAIYSFRLLVFTLFLNSVADYFALVLNSHHRFYIAAIAPAINAAISTIVLSIWPEYGLDTLIAGLLAGLIVQILVVGVTLGKLEINFVFPRSFISADIKHMWSLVLPVLLGVAVANANISVDQAMATLAGEGSVSILGYAGRLHNVVAQTSIMAISVVLLPNLVTLIARDELSKALVLLRTLFSYSLIAAIALLLFIMAVGEEALAFIVSRGSFNRENVSQVYGVWLIYSLGIFPMACGIFYAKLIQALQKPWILTMSGIISFFCNIVLNLLLVGRFGVSGIAASTTMVYGILVIFFWLKTRRLSSDNESLQ